MVDVERLRRESRWFAQLTLVLLAIVAALVIVSTGTSVANAYGRSNEFGTALAWALIVWAPTLFYLYGLWAIRTAFMTFSRGGIFGAPIAGACVHAGAAIAAGATMSAVGVPNLRRAFVIAGVIPAPPHRLGPVLNFDTAYLAVGLVGLALILLGRLLARATEVQAEAARLKGELDEIF